MPDLGALPPPVPNSAVYPSGKPVVPSSNWKAVVGLIIAGISMCLPLVFPIVSIAMPVATILLALWVLADIRRGMRSSRTLAITTLVLGIASILVNAVAFALVYGFFHYLEVNNFG